MTAGALNVIKNNSNVIFCMNPQITFFKSVYRKYTKFARTEKIVDGGTLSKTTDDVKITISSDGDLLSNISLNIICTDMTSEINGSNIANDIGTQIFEDVTLKVKRTAEKLSSKYINMHARLNNPISTDSTYQINDNKTIICTNGNKYQNMSLCGGVINTTPIFSASRSEPNCSYTNFNIIIPLPFSFSKDTGTALPVFLFWESSGDISLDVRINKTWLNDSTKSIVGNNDISKISLKAICTWYDISEYEQRRFKSSDQEYLVEKIKDHHNNTSPSINIRDLLSNQPIKGIYLVCNGTHTVSADNKILHYNNIKYQLKIGTVGLFNDFLPHTYFSKKNIYEYFIGCNYSETLTNFLSTKIEGNVAFIPFCLKMSDGPSGCINSKNALDLEITGNHDDLISIDIYIIYYNILKISDKYVKYVYTPD